MAAYFLAEGRHHAYVIAFGALPGEHRAAHFSSPDGSRWEESATDPFRDIGIEFSAPGPIPTSVVHLPDGTWAMYLWGIEAPLTDGADVFRATSESPAGPWVSDGQPVLQVGPRGNWDDRAIDFPSVVAVGDGYRMLYSGITFSDPNSSWIGLASSDDGVAWVKEPQPVVGPGMCGDLDSSVAAMPRLLDRGDSYLLLYESERRAVAAMSTDLRSWTCAGETFVLEPSDIPGSGDDASEGIHSFAAAGDDEEINVLIESLTGGGASEIWQGRLSLP